MSKSTTIAGQLKSRGSQGNKTVPCVACQGDIPPYAGRPVNLLANRYAHQPGQCVDRAERSAAVRELIGQGELFAWSCRHIEPAGDIPGVCDSLGTDRAEYEAHMRAHGATALKVPARTKLRTTAPAAKLGKLDFSPLKFITWTEMHDGAEVTYRAQFWSLAEAAHGVWVIRLDTQELVELYRDGDGNWSRNWSDAAASRREANRRTKRQAA